MFDNSVLQYPHGQIALGSGDLMQATNFKFSFKNGAKQVHTLRRPDGAGIVFGNRECTVTFDCVIDEDGPERDWVKMVQDGEIKQLRIKVPGKTYTVSGAFDGVDSDNPQDSESKWSLSFVGRFGK